jgi:molybdate transport system substrate-binding protein
MNPPRWLNFALLCTSFGGALLAQSAPSRTLLVAAAADLAPLEVPLSQGFARQSGLAVQFTFGASGMLARQIEFGAPYDVFLSANEDLVEHLVVTGHAERASVTLYASGRLGLWSAHAPLASLADLAQSRYVTIALPNPAHAPYGVAAVELLKNTGLWPKLQTRVVYGENVRQALEYAASGNADAVLTAWTLLRLKPGAKLLDGKDMPVVRQSGAVVTGSPHAAAARAFMAYLLSPAGQATLRNEGLFPSPGGHESAR